MKVLSIGNSFSQDAQRYLHQIAKHDGVDLKAVNLYIGGCSLKRHYLNMIDDNAVYDFEFNGEKTGIQVSIRQALISDDWDCITLQQASHFSGDSATYFPYIEALTDYIRKYCPHSKIFLHQTWAYEEGCARLKEVAGFETSKEMLSALCNAYEKAAKAIKADGVIPCGLAMAKATELGIEKIHRDTFHAALGAGRYLLALCWYKVLTGNDILENRFSEFDVPVTEVERKIVIAAVNATVK